MSTRDALTITALTVNAGNAVPAGITYDPANGVSITGAAHGHKVLVEITNTGGTAGTATFKAGDNPPAFRAGIGDLEVAVAATSGDKLFVLETARFAQDDGTISVDFTEGMTGKIKAMRLPAEA